MDTRFKDVKVLIWDFDGTLYKPIAALWQEIIDSCYQVIMKSNSWSKEKTVAEFNKIYRVKTPSTTKTTAILSGLTIAQVSFEVEKYKDRTKYLKPDEKLIQLFVKLKSFTHYLLVNGIIEKTEEGLTCLGIKKEIFSEIVTSEIVGENKPSPKGYLYIMQKTKLPAQAHLMIGDREAVDLAPAKKLGMKTCLVWSEAHSNIADVTLPTVYAVANLLI